MTKIKLIDLVNVTPDKTLVSLSKKEKHSLMDSMFREGPSSRERGLRITYDLSHSARLINNRIYTVQGQRDGIESVLEPYRKPILLHHSDHTDPIGRFTGARWEDLSAQAMSFFGNIRDFMAFKRAFDEDDIEAIVKVLNKNNLVTNSDWPGLGRMRVQATIVDEDAIEKFLDGRYLTFSAGSTTDRLVCSICKNDWIEDDMCEHWPGLIYDGEPCFHITGAFQVIEGSVVNVPADDLAQIQSMEVLDGAEIPLENKDNLIDSNSIVLSDSIYNFTENSMPRPKKNKDNAATSEVTTENSTTEATTGTTEATAEATNEAEANTTEETETATTEETGETETGTTEVALDSESLIAGAVDKVIASLVDRGILKVASDTATDESTAETETAADETATDAATDETEPAVDTETFGDAEGELDIASALKAIVDRLDALETATTTTTETATETNEAATEETTNETENAEATTELADAFTSLAKALGKDVDGINEDAMLETMRGWLSDSSNQVPEKTVENPSEASSDTQDGSKVLDKATEGLGTFEKEVVIKYHSILDSTGQDAAERFLMMKANYLPRGFHPNNYR